jgi:hypothetical protein
MARASNDHLGFGSMNIVVLLGDRAESRGRIGNDARALVRLGGTVVRHFRLTGSVLPLARGMQPTASRAPLVPGVARPPRLLSARARATLAAVRLPAVASTADLH